MILGIIGLVMLLVGWSFEAVKTLRQKKGNLDLKFGILYSIGTFLLILYALQTRDIIFTILNSAVLILTLISLYYSIKK